ncbi:Hpt domain-containing protein [Pseudomonas sp. 7P_10.2_Bac1]|uniref:Hpt domain-containing protein n=1 Tax=Pseudomonas sp. 7P_10.2_Bac1 TaxID=2971614 RepID=UPI0021C637D0|nr:Hpt domain-containing protein [Pseudomonas sp. 7P_10.2_Bac1]MCU1728263.1 Hpt domain-containing protein [Pseudomonas sp. 7P_10.2_Bac1]
MVDRRDYVALEWVKDEIADTLKQARTALEDYVLQPGAEALEQCLDAIHQVHGSLQMVEFYGAALLAEETEQLVLALQQGRVSQTEEALQVLMQALLQLPLYLDRVHSARRDWPLVVLPLINDLRTARGESLLSETSLFSPDLHTLPTLDQTALAHLSPAEWPRQIMTLRHALQAALQGVQGEEDLRGNLERLANVFSQLESLCQGAPINALWKIASALVEGMLRGRVANSPALRSLLKESDKELHRLLEQGIHGVNQPAPDELLTSLLFYIAKAEQPTSKMLALKNRYELDEAMPDAAMVDEERARLAGPDRDAMRSVVSALCEELVRVKERLDLFVRSDRLHVSELSSLMAPLRQIADTLAVLGFGQPRKVIIDQLAVVQGIAQGQREPTDAVLMDVAAALLYVEATLAGMVGSVEPSAREESRLPTTDLIQIHQLVIKEARTGLEEAKDLIADYLTDGHDRQHLQPLLALLTQIRGALAMIPLNRVAGLLNSCHDFVAEHLLVGPLPLTAQLDHLADALISIEYYLERLALDPGAASEKVLERAEKSLVALGYTPAKRHVLVLDDAHGANQPKAGQDVPRAGVPKQSLAEVLAGPLSLNPAAKHVPQSLLPPPVGEEPVDEELLEVFLEETDEVLIALHDALPQWVANPADSAALAELRRAFHTLKGSGRMVRALVLGELAWAVESLLNRVIERKVAAAPAIYQLLEEVLVILPQLIQEFADRSQRQHDDVDQLAARAHNLSRGQPQPLQIEQQNSGFDPQLLDIFRQEAQTHLGSLNHFLDLASEQLPLYATDDLQLAMHTLKGSAYMAGVLRMAELAAPLDYLVREFKAHHLELDMDEIDLLLEADSLLHRGLKQLDIDPLAEIRGARALIERTKACVSKRLDMALNAPSGTLVAPRDPQRISEFLTQSMDILFEAETLLQYWRQNPHERGGLEMLLEQLTALGESAFLLDLQPVDALCEALLDLYGAVEESSLVVSERFFQEADAAQEALIDMLDQLAAGQEITPQPQRIDALQALLHEGLAPDATGLIRREGNQALDITELGAATAQLGANPHEAEGDEIVALFIEEAVDILESTGHALRRWISEPENPAPLSSLQRDLHTLKGGARMAGIVPIADLAHELEHLYEGLLDRRLSESPTLARLLELSHAQLVLLLEQLQHQQPLDDPIELVEAIRSVRLGPPAAVEPISPTLPASTTGAHNGIDPELLDIFLEEAFDLLESSGAALVRWQAEPQSTIEDENLLRDLHTLKGGARMVEITAIGDFAHELETLVEDISLGFLSASAELFTLLQRSHDQLAQMLDALRSGQPVPSPQVLIGHIQQVERSVRQAIQSPVANKPEPAAGLLPEAERTGLDMLKVPAELLEDLVNLAGETSMIRGRLEQQVNDGKIALNEMQTTLERMHDQLRRLDTETQSRIHSRQYAEVDGVAYDEFDPLEMDRHSQLQQLSRALFESASDLLDLKATLAARNQDAYSLLQKQGRVHTQLQEGLMGTRMVPFERVLPRLKRVVRQVATELNKQVEFSVINAEAEIDRNVLERMVAPLEHMLRNAVDHGMEPSDVRLASGKPEQGLITLELSNEGGDVVFDIRDDGAGVPLEAVRRKAILRGLLDPQASISDRDVLQFILQPGFSTAEKITQISGRGVGMDVVHEEVRQLGGNMTIDSMPGQGVHFQIRLPFSVSLNRALMVQCGDEQYAIALNTVEGIVRVMPNELEDYYQLDPPMYHYAGLDYELRYLGELLQTVGKPQLIGQSHSLPVLLVHCNDQRVALHVDALVGSREIVVKSLGPQFTGVQGVSGATILGDGRVVLILDLLAYLRAHQARQPLQRAINEANGLLEFTPAVRPPLVLVVDDSVTVRKVTSRLLERNGMNVITAKDGVDAMSVLEDHTPDLLLLDIEMPRMDGFEVATHVRNNPRLKDLPIIMITSRTGQKHQNRAMAIGVNDYLGKPYQESVLLERIAYWSTFHA